MKDFACPVRRSTRPQVPRHSTGTRPPAGRAPRLPRPRRTTRTGRQPARGGWRSRTRTPRPPPTPSENREALEGPPQHERARVRRRAGTGGARACVFALGSTNALGGARGRARRSKSPSGFLPPGPHVLAVGRRAHTWWRWPPGKKRRQSPRPAKDQPYQDPPQEPTSEWKTYGIFGT